MGFLGVFRGFGVYPPGVPPPGHRVEPWEGGISEGDFLGPQTSSGSPYASTRYPIAKELILDVIGGSQSLPVAIPEELSYIPGGLVPTPEFLPKRRFSTLKPGGEGTPRGGPIFTEF